MSVSRFQLTNRESVVIRRKAPRRFSRLSHARFFLTTCREQGHAGTMRIATFNVQNLRLRHSAGRARFDGARDYDVPQDNTPEATALDLADRRLTSAILAQADADVVCLQEVFDRTTLDFFHDHLMRHAGAQSYPHRVCMKGNDGGGRDLAVLSRYPLHDVRSHANFTPADLGLTPPHGMRSDVPIFRRDCLFFRVGELNLFHCHFKAPWPDTTRAWPIRRMEALAVRKLVEARFKNDPSALWIILGDLNEPAEPQSEDPAVTPLLPPFSVDLLARMPKDERWTFYNSQDGQYGQPDALLASHALTQRWPDVIPRALRAGLDRRAIRSSDARLTDVGSHRPHASDHAAIVLDLDGL